MSQYPECNHGHSDPNAVCQACEWEDKIDALSTELAATRLEMETLKTERDNAIEHNQHMLNVAAAAGGGWMVIRAIRKAGYSVEVRSRGAEDWQVIASNGGDPVAYRAATMEEAARMVGVAVLPPDSKLNEPSSD